LRLRTPNAAVGNVSLGAMGTSDQWQKWGHLQLAFANTEPGCGSDSKAIETTAVLDGDEWVLNGEKIFVSNGVTCGGAVVFATLDRSAGRGAIKAFLVERDAPGFEFVKKEHKMGLRAGDTAGFILRDCRIPRENLLGLDEEIKTGGGGFKGIMQTFNLTRPGVASVSIGIASACEEIVEEALKQEGIEVDWEAGPHRRSAVQEKMIALSALLDAARLTILRAVWLAGVGKPNNVESSVCKAKGGNVSRQCLQMGVELLGSLGITHDTLVEKQFRDARIGDIYEGTGEIQRLVVARAILSYSSADLM
jgi:acyl-CoA dehydrogenase